MVTVTDVADPRVATDLANYPAKGEPFPPLPAGWSAHASASHGHYYFQEGKSQRTYKHPGDGKEWKVAPQAFALAKDAMPDELSSQLPADANVSSMDARRWLLDQRSRNNALDALAVRLYGITYKLRQSGDEGAAGPSPATAADAASPVAPADDE